MSKLKRRVYCICGSLACCVHNHRAQAYILRHEWLFVVSSSESVESAEIADRGFLFLANVALFAEATLIFYEYGITINSEVRLIWRRKVTGASILFVLNRYIMIMDNIVTLASFPAMSNRSYVSICYALAWIDVVLNLLPYFVWNGIHLVSLLHDASVRDIRTRLAHICAGVRPYARADHLQYLQHTIRVPGQYASSVWLLVRQLRFACNARHIAVDMQSHISPWRSTVVLISRVPLMAGDAIVILVTWWKTYKLKKAADEARVTISLVDLLLRDGSIYFATMLVVNSLHIMMNYIVKISFLGDVADVITSILISRFIMNLRDIDGKETGEISYATRTEHGGPGSWHATSGRSELEGGGRGRGHGHGHGTLVFAAPSGNFVESMGGALEHSMWARSSYDSEENETESEDVGRERGFYGDGSGEGEGDSGSGEKTSAEAASSTVLA
ncbi:hypothetical protein ONZ51_g1676 [Trametes cubensis]|uniref:DUF6533 domain-containing protein n=1 Tax=Trametes cubensis TaxID=1111947 RepID=A0AAD7U3N4_9APHY|nr:hypothetical protein ONZ51_g1676 [Trametes cubensis]